MGPTTGDKQAEAQALADELLGTCDALPDHALDDRDLLEHLDTLVRLCDACGWWVEAHEMDNDDNCTECSEHDDEWSA